MIIKTPKFWFKNRNEINPILYTLKPFSKVWEFVTKFRLVNGLWEKMPLPVVCIGNITVEGSENLETEGGYAKETSDDFKKKQEELLSETLKKIDIVICTALIPGRKAPLIIKENMIENMQAGSVIYDLAAIQGGNTALTEVNKIIDRNGVKIMGESNILNKLPVSASNLYAKNIFNFIDNLFDKESKKMNINLEDEIIKNTLIK